MYALLCLTMWTVPLLSIIHVESSAVVATAAFFVAGLSTFALLRTGVRLGRILVLQEVALLVPWLLLTVSMLWQPNCDYARGLLFFLIFPPVTVVFAVSTARLLQGLPIRRKRTWLVAVGLLLIVLPPLYDVGIHPQFYTYNHVFGGFLGPIYDEQLSVRPGLFAFRALTLLWSALFLLVASWLEGGGRSSRLRVTAATVAMCVAATYLWAPSLGIITTYERIEDVLGGVERTRHFEIYYDPAHTTDEALRRLIDAHEYRYAELQEMLDVEVDGPIRSYVYPSADVKAHLIGARYTNVAPVWLSEPQTHVLAANFEEAFPHELVHVFSREFGLPVIRASVSLGLLEGLAVALQPPNGRPGPHEQVSAALLGGHLPTTSGETVEDLVDVVSSHLSPLGFWTGRGAVSYTTMGSFVRYLIDAYGPEPFIRAYPTAAFRQNYGKAPAALAEEWTRHVLSLDAVGRSTADLVAARFAVPSLFEKDCPHFTPPYRRRLIDAQRELARGDSAAAYRLASEAVTLEGDYVPALDLWSRLALLRSEAEQVVARLDDLDTGRSAVPLLVRRGDALALLGRGEEARRSYERARELLPSFAHETNALVQLRHVLADDRQAVSILIGASDPELETRLDEPANRLAVGLAMARNGRYEQAIDLMRTISVSSISAVATHFGGELARRRLFWLAEFSYERGHLTDAAAYAESAESAYRAVGAFSEADVLHDFRTKIIWLATEETERIAEDRPKSFQ